MPAHDPTLGKDRDGNELQPERRGPDTAERRPRELLAMDHAAGTDYLRPGGGLDLSRMTDPRAWHEEMHKMAGALELDGPPPELDAGEKEPEPEPAPEEDADATRSDRLQAAAKHADAEASKKYRERPISGAAIWEQLKPRYRKTLVKAIHKKHAKKIARLEAALKKPSADKAAIQKKLTAARAAATVAVEKWKRGKYYWPDARSLDAIRGYAKASRMSYDHTWASQAGGYSWCGGFVADSYQFANKSFGASLAHVAKAKKFFQYKGRNGAGYVRVKEEGPLDEQLVPLKTYHQQQGSVRELRWAGSLDTAFIEPGTMAFCSRRRGKLSHMTVALGAEDRQGVLVVRTAEGNAPGAKTAKKQHARHKDRKAKRKDKEAFSGVAFDLTAAAKPALADFDGVKYVTPKRYKDLKKKERAEKRKARRQKRKRR